MKTVAAMFTLALIIALWSIAPQHTTITPAVIYDVVQCQDGTIAPAHLCPQRTIRLPAQIQQTHEVAYLSTPQVTTSVEEKPAETGTESLMQSFLDKAPAAYWFNDGQYTIYASGEMRSTGEWKEYPFTAPGLLYWNVENNQTFLYLGDIPDRWWDRHKNHVDGPRNSYEVESAPMSYKAGLFQLNLDRNKLTDAARVPTRLNKYFTGLADWAVFGLYFPYYSESPIEWMQRYAKETPIAIDIAERDLPSPGRTTKSNLSIHYQSIESPRMEFVPNQHSYINSKEVPDQVIFRFDHRGIPSVIDEVSEDGNLLRRHAYQLDTTHLNDGNHRTPVSPTIAQLPPHIILTLNDYDIWLESLER